MSPRFGRIVAAVSLSMGLLAAAAQTPPPQQQSGGCTQTDASGKQVFVPNCGLKPGEAAPAATEKSKSAAQSFPFPGESPESGTPSAAAGKAASGASSSATEPGSSPNKRFPFPGQSDATPDAPAAGGLKDAGSSGSSSSSGGDSSSSSSSSSQDGLGGLDRTPGGTLPGEDDDAAAAAAAARHAKKRAVPVVRQTPSEREAEDLQVAGYYQNDANFRGAYLRATDAVSIAETDPDAHFALAEAARRLGKLDEAEKHYKRCLELDPVEKEKKAAEKALKQMLAGG